jgi:hypothetical protein
VLVGVTADGAALTLAVTPALQTALPQSVASP